MTTLGIAATDVSPPAGCLDRFALTPLRAGTCTTVTGTSQGVCV
jgi:hypothetical protein